MANLKALEPYSLTRADLDKIRDAELIFGTPKLLPPPGLIPDDFRAGNVYTQLAEALFFKRPLPDAVIEFKPEFADAGAPAALHRCVQAHLVSHAKKHDRKIAAVGFMIAQVCEIHAHESPSADKQGGV